MKFAQTMVLVFLAFVASISSANSATLIKGGLCSISPAPEDTTKYVVEVSGKIVGEKTNFSVAKDIVKSFVASKICSEISDSTRVLFSQSCEASLCGDGAMACFLPCQCNGMQCVVY